MKNTKKQPIIQTTTTQCIVVKLPKKRGLRTRTHVRAGRFNIEPLVRP